MKKIAIFLLAALLALGCQDRTTNPSSPGVNLASGPSVVGDAGAAEGDVSFDKPVRALCLPGSRRCLAENSPLFDQCAPDGDGYVRGACEEGEVCREGACVPFTCVEGRGLCVGATTSAVCDETGTSVKDIEECLDASVCRGGACIDPCADARDARSYIGCDYVAQELPNLYKARTSTTGAPFAVVVANPAELVDANLTLGSSTGAVGLQQSFELVPSSRYAFAERTTLRSELLLEDGTSEPLEDRETVSIPPGAAAVLLLFGSNPFQIQSDRPVVAYQFSPYCCNFTATNDASLLLPTSTWGKRYRVLGYPSWRVSRTDDFLRSYFSIVTDAATTVSIEAPAPIRRIGTAGASKSFDIDMMPGESVTFEAAHDEEARRTDVELDLTGTLIESEEPIGVFTGHPCTFVPQDEWACDHLEEMLLPTQTWGKGYVLNPLRRRSRPKRHLTEGTYWRIVADEPTSIGFDPPLDELEVLAASNESSPDCVELFDGESVELAAGEFCEFGTTEPVALESEKPVMVGAVVSGHQSTGVAVYGTQAGDPSMFILPPVEQFRNDYAFVTPPTFKRTYVTVASRPSSPVTIDDRAIPEEKRLERRSVSLGGETWEVFTLALEPGVHSMASESRFGIVVYAYDDYVSYAFIGGLDLLPKGAGRQ